MGMENNLESVWIVIKCLIISLIILTLSLLSMIYKNYCFIFRLEKELNDKKIVKTKICIRGDD